MDKAYFNWSGGKDSAMALYHLQREGKINVRKLLTTVSQEYQRITMHGVRIELLERQSKVLGIPLQVVELPWKAGMKEYDQIMGRVIGKLKKEGYSHGIFGDIFLEDLRIYREEKLEGTGIEALFPIWKRNTKGLLKEFINSGFRAIVVCANAQLLDESFVGREIDQTFMDELPKNVDPCGENGEFHSFVFDGPIFSKAISIQVGEKVLRSYETDKDQSWDSKFWYCDLILNK